MRSFCPLGCFLWIAAGALLVTGNASAIEQPALESIVVARKFELNTETYDQPSKIAAAIVAGRISAPLSAAQASRFVRELRGAERAAAIGYLAPLLVQEVPAPEASQILGDASVLAGPPRHYGIRALALAHRLSKLGEDAAIMLSGLTGSTRANAIADIAPFLRDGLTAKEAAIIFGAIEVLNEANRHYAIRAVALAKRFAPLGEDASAFLDGTTGSNRANAIADLAPFLRDGWSAREAAAVLGRKDTLAEANRHYAIRALALAKRFAPLGEDASTLLDGTTGSNRANAIADLAQFLKNDLSASEAAAVLGGKDTLAEANRHYAIRAVALAKRLAPLGEDASTLLDGATGSNRANAIAAITPFLKEGLNANEAATILGTKAILNEANRHYAIRAVALAKRFGPLGGDASAMLDGTTGSNRANSIADIAPFLKDGLSAYEAATVLGSKEVLNEGNRHHAIRAIARNKKFRRLGADASTVLHATTGSNRANAIQDIAPFLISHLSAMDGAEILGCPSQLAEGSRHFAIRVIAEHQKFGPLGHEAVHIIDGTTGSNRQAAVSTLKAHLVPGVSSESLLAAKTASECKPIAVDVAGETSDNIAQDSCGAPHPAMKIKYTPSCRQQWETTIFREKVSFVFHTFFAYIDEWDKASHAGHKYSEYLLSIIDLGTFVGSALGTAEASSKVGLLLLKGEFLLLSDGIFYFVEDSKETALSQDLTKTTISVVEAAIESQLDNPGVPLQIPLAAGDLANNMLAYMNAVRYTRMRNTYLVAQTYLSKLYQHGGDQTSLAASLGLSESASSVEIIKVLNSSNFGFSTGASSILEPMSVDLHLSQKIADTWSEKIKGLALLMVETTVRQ